MARLEFRFHEPMVHVQRRGRNVVVVPRRSADDDATLSGGRTFLGASRALSQLSHGEIISRCSSSSRPRLCVTLVYHAARRRDEAKKNGTAKTIRARESCTPSLARGFSNRVSNPPRDRLQRDSQPAVVQFSRRFGEKLPRACFRSK